MTVASRDAAPASPRPSVAQALLILTGVFVAIAAYIGLSLALGSQEFFIGFFFVFYWTAVQKADLRALPSTAAGAFFGVALGLLLQMLSARFGVYGGVIFIAPVLLVIFLLLRGHLRMIINDSTMLMLTVATIAHVQTDAKFSHLFTSLAIAVVFFGGVLWIIDRIKTRSSAATR